MKNRIYLKTLSPEEAWDVIKNNTECTNEIYDNCYQSRMYIQKEQAEAILGNSYYKYISIENLYSNFYLSLKNPIQFINNIDKDYLSEEDGKLYDECVALRDKYYNTEDDSEYERIIFELFEDKCIILLKHIEDYLHTYENITEEDLKEEFMEYCHPDTEWYYYEGEPEVICLDYTKLYR